MMNSDTNSQVQLPQSIYEALFDADGYIPEWQMSTAERCALIMLLSKLRPECAIEIGTAQGGSLSVLSRFSRQVYSLDINPHCREHLGSRFPNVTFITGRSQETLPQLLALLQETGPHPGFILIDGDHSRSGLKRDIENVLTFRPTQPLYVLMHDSFNPDCRQGITDVGWAANPFVHFVELDFVPGILQSRQEFFYKQMWGGFALALLLPVEREGDLRINADCEMLYQIVLPHSAHR